MIFWLILLNKNSSNTLNYNNLYHILKYWSSNIYIVEQHIFSICNSVTICYTGFEIYVTVMNKYSSYFLSFITSTINNLVYFFSSFCSFGIIARWICYFELYLNNTRRYVLYLSTKNSWEIQQDKRQKDRKWNMITRRLCNMYITNINYFASHKEAVWQTNCI